MKQKHLTLLIMAAGMGSRFGGLKQIEKFGPTGEFLIDYSIYDAIQTGFDKVVFIIKEENYKVFKETVGKRVEKVIPVEYAFQKLELVPVGVKIPEYRVKPWGTAHAILCAKQHIDGNFAVINADDFYGRNAFEVISKFLKQKSTEKLPKYGLIGYQVTNTLTENGSVKRGVCQIQDGRLIGLTESNILKIDDQIIATPLDGRSNFEVAEDTLVSMNLLGFDSSIFTYIEMKMNHFFEENKTNLQNCEFLIPDILTMAIKEDYAMVEVLPTTSKWIGVTYPEDKKPVQKSLNEMIESNIYPKDLWK